MRRVLFLCLLPLVGCMTATPPVERAPIDVPYDPTSDPEMAPCSEEKLRLIVEPNVRKAVTYPPYSAHREVYIDAINAAFFNMKIYMHPLQREMCSILQHAELQRVELRIEDGK